MRSKKRKLVKSVGAVSPDLPVSMSMSKSRSSDQTVSATEAARELTISSRSLRRVAEAGKIRSFRTPGGYIRIKREDLDAYKQSLNLSSVSSLVPSRLDGMREELQNLNLELQERRLRRDVERLRREDAEAARQRAEAVSAERMRSRAADEQARRVIKERKQREEEAASRKQWESAWYDWLRIELERLPRDVPEESRDQITDVVRQELDSCYQELSGHAEDLVEQKLRVAISKVLRPWVRSQQEAQRSQQAGRAADLAVNIGLVGFWGQPELKRRAREQALAAAMVLPENASFLDMQSGALAAVQQVVRQHEEQQDRRSREEKAERVLRQFLIPYLKYLEGAPDGINFQGQFDHDAELIRADIKWKLIEDPRLLNVYFPGEQRVKELVDEWLATSLNEPRPVS